MAVLLKEVKQVVVTLPETVTLCSSDGKEFKLSKDIAMKMGCLRSMLTDIFGYMGIVV